MSVKYSLAIFCILIKTTIATVPGYCLQYNITADVFLDGDEFAFDTANDSSHGYVNFLSRQQAINKNLVKKLNDRLYLTVDQTNVVPATARGRDSIRLISKTSYQGDLFILDAERMPVRQCGVWPGFYIRDADNPNSGVINIVEGVNLAEFNTMSLHTREDCPIATTGNFSGHVVTKNCYVNAIDQPKYSGCSIVLNNNKTYGDPFNRVKGGVFATELNKRNNTITIWFYRRDMIPTDILNGKPNPRTWSKPMAIFSGCCNFTSNYKNLNLILDINFCGDKAGGQTWLDSVCSDRLARNCKDYVRKTTKGFEGVLWYIRSLSIYTYYSGAESYIPPKCQ
ncbi:Beta 1,3 (4)-glucanase [Aphelenchoides besseyi]|nr:Beta 1,3 (4)-glucanase [Aphelenchoides besseyi]